GDDLQKVEADSLPGIRGKIAATNPPAGVVFADSCPSRERIERRKQGVGARIAQLYAEGSRDSRAAGCITRARRAAEDPLDSILPGDVARTFGNSYILVHPILHRPRAIKAVPGVVEPV